MFTIKSQYYYDEIMQMINDWIPNKPFDDDGRTLQEVAIDLIDELVCSVNDFTFTKTEGGYLLLLLKERKLKIKDAAKEMNCSTNHLYMMIQGKRPISDKFELWLEKNDVSFATIAAYKKMKKTVEKK